MAQSSVAPSSPPHLPKRPHIWRIGTLLTENARLVGECRNRSPCPVGDGRKKTATGSETVNAHCLLPLFQEMTPSGDHLGRGGEVSGSRRHAPCVFQTAGVERVERGRSVRRWSVDQGGFPRCEAV